MADEQEPRPRTLKPFRKEHATGAIVLPIVAVAAAIAAAIFTIWSASQPPRLP